MKTVKYPIKTQLVIKGLLTLVIITAVAFFICFTRFDIGLRVSYGIGYTETATKAVASSPGAVGLQPISGEDYDSVLNPPFMRNPAFLSSDRKDKDKDITIYGKDGSIIRGDVDRNGDVTLYGKDGEIIFGYID